MTMISNTVVEAVSLIQLIEEMNELEKDGYLPQGGIFVMTEEGSSSNSTRLRFFHSMYRKPDFIKKD